jgi:toxin-antitoxin system PIN domain toxin
MSDRALLDVSVLIPLFDPAHVHHRRARGWWGKGEEWATCPLTQNGFVRIISQPGYPSPVSTAEAASELRKLVAVSGHEFWPDDVSIADPQVFDHTRILGPNQITDLYLLALAVKREGRLVTFDRGIPIAAVRGAEAQHIVVI